MLADWVAQYGIGLGVITLGPGGAVAVDPEGTRTAVQGFPTTVVDTVGAGDTFMAGFLDGYVGHEIGLEAALDPRRRGRVDRVLPPGRPAADRRPRSTP